MYMEDCLGGGNQQERGWRKKRILRGEEDVSI
jgi:hypothetical protein